MKGACCFNGVWPTSGRLTCPELSPKVKQLKRASRSKTPMPLAPHRSQPSLALADPAASSVCKICEWSWFWRYS